MQTAILSVRRHYINVSGAEGLKDAALVSAKFGNSIAACLNPFAPCAQRDIRYRRRLDPAPADALEFVFPAVLEHDSRAGDKIPHRR